MPGGAVTMASKEACAMHSLSNPSALFWTYRPDNGNCWLKSSDSGRRRGVHHVSGNRECGRGEYINNLGNTPLRKKKSKVIVQNKSKLTGL